MASPSTLLRRELRTIHISFQRLARSFGRLGPGISRLAQAASKPVAAPVEETPSRRRPRLSAKQRAALKLQGRYMGTMRGLPKTKRAQVKRIRVEKGIRAAVAAAQRLAS